MGTQHSVAIVGAGVSGTSAIQHLNRNTVDVDCYEKSRGSGGRASTKRVESENGTTFHFDHGAQYFTAREQPFQQFVQTGLDRGAIQEWSPEIGVAERDEVRPKCSDTTRYVPTPGMSSLAGMMLGEVEPETSCRVEQVIPTRNGIQLTTGRGHSGDYDAAVVTAPPPQSADLVKPCSSRLSRICRSIEMRPVWSVLLGFEKQLPVRYDAVFVNEGPLDWMARNSSKPQRPDGESWVLHSTPHWAEHNLKRGEQQVIEQLWNTFIDWFDGVGNLEPSISLAHRWRFARADEPGNQGVLFDESNLVTVAGDWLSGNRIEGAFVSGRKAASTIIHQLGS